MPSSPAIHSHITARTWFWNPTTRHARSGVCFDPVKNPDEERKPAKGTKVSKPYFAQELADILTQQPHRPFTIPNHISGP
jgi:hypothetical protein